MQNTYGNSRVGGPGMAALRMAIFGSLSGALVGAIFAVAIVSIWLENRFEPRLLAVFGALFGGVSGAAMGSWFSGLQTKTRR